MTKDNNHMVKSKAVLPTLQPFQSVANQMPAPKAQRSSKYSSPTDC